MSVEEREVIDPVAHTYIRIHDNTSDELQQTSIPNVGNDEGDDSAMRHTVREEEQRRRWRIPAQRALRNRNAIYSALAAVAGSSAGVILFFLSYKAIPSISFIKGLIAGGVMCFTTIGVAATTSLYLGRSLQSTQDEPEHEDTPIKTDGVESAMWLNFFLRSVWPIMNPALFTSIADMLEDALQASLPKMVKGVRVTDLGQGTEPVRILAIRGLHSSKDSNSCVPFEDYVNLELSLAYKSREGGKSLKGRSQNAHLLLQFWASGNIEIPVWVELTGFIATARVRLQLTPNPPFLSTMTLTFLGLPKVTLNCTPLSKNFFNIMEVPGLSEWLQQAIDAAVSNFVAPHSLNLDLKTMLSGREKLDTDAHGVIVVNIHSAEGFRSGDAGKVWHSDSSDHKRGDGYVTIGWGKLGKAVWSTRIIENDGRPVWNECTFMLVNPSDVSAEERLRLQLWDSDRFTADDLLGAVEIPLKDLMNKPESLNRMLDRQDGLSAVDGDTFPGTLYWSCGYYPKTTLKQHISLIQGDPEDVESEIRAAALQKLREAIHDESTENIDRHVEEDLKERTDEIIAGSPPIAEWLSGILSIRVVQIKELELQDIHGSVKKDEDEGRDDLPSAYCTIILNHERVFKTRTKMKSSKPYFDAGTERFIRNWRTVHLMISVRDSRVHEADPLLGVVVLDIRQFFKARSQYTDTLPLSGGIGCGRVHFSLSFRSVQVKLPRELAGWDVGTLEIQPQVRITGDAQLLHSLQLGKCRIVFKTLYGKGKMVTGSEPNSWVHKRGRPIHLPIKRRYSSCLSILFQRQSLGFDSKPAFCILWLRNITDAEETNVDLPIRRNTDSLFKRACSSAIDDKADYIGLLHLKIRLWPGLSGYHKAVAEHDTDMVDVMQVLDCAVESKGKNVELASDSLISFSSSESESESDASKSSALNEITEYRKRQGELHRKHRGLMQWSAARNIAWFGHEVGDHAENIVSKVKGTLKHQQMEGGMDQEV